MKRKKMMEKEMMEKEKMNEAKRAAIYVRVSTAEQKTHLQQAELDEYCERRGWRVLIHRERGPKRHQSGHRLALKAT